MGELKTNFSYFSFQSVWSRAGLLVVAFCLSSNAMGMFWVSGFYGSIILLRNNYNSIDVFPLLRKKASKFSNYQGNAALGVYHYEAVNKNATFSLAKRLFIPNEFLKTKGKILLLVTPV